MRKITNVLCIIVLTVVAAHAQDYKKFRLATGLGYAKPGGEGAGGGILYDIEPGYRINDALCVSLRYEGAVMVRGLSEGNASYDADAAAIGSYSVNGIYYFGSNKFRPYAGLGVGFFNLAAVSVGTTGAGAAAESKIGFYPRIGFDLGHFNINIDYNILGPTKFENVVTTGGEDIETKNSYIGIRIGGFFFGGKK